MSRRKFFKQGAALIAAPALAVLPSIVPSVIYTYGKYRFKPWSDYEYVGVKRIYANGRLIWAINLSS